MRLYARLLWLTLTVLCTTARGELLATEREDVSGSWRASGSWRFISIDTASGKITPKSDWSRVPFFGNGGEIATLEGVSVNGRVLVQKAKVDGSFGGQFDGYFTWDPTTNLNQKGHPVVFPNASGQPQMLETFGVSGAMWAVHEATSIHSVNKVEFKAKTLDLYSIVSKESVSLAHLATLGPYGGVIREADGSVLPSTGVVPRYGGERPYRVTGDADNAYILLRYDKQNYGLEDAGYPPMYEWTLSRVPTNNNTGAKPISKIFLNNNITIPCFKSFKFVFKKPTTSTTKLLLLAHANCDPNCVGLNCGHNTLYEIEIEAFDAPSSDGWVVRADTRKGWSVMKFGAFYTYDDAKQTLYTMDFWPRYRVSKTDLSEPKVTTTHLFVITDPQPHSQPGATYSLSGLGWVPDL